MLFVGYNTKLMNMNLTRGLELSRLRRRLEVCLARLHKNFFLLNLETNDFCVILVDFSRLLNVRPQLSKSFTFETNFGMFEHC